MDVNAARAKESESRVMTVKRKSAIKTETTLWESVSFILPLLTSDFSDCIESLIAGHMIQQIHPTAPALCSAIDVVDTYLHCRYSCEPCRGSIPNSVVAQRSTSMLSYAVPGNITLSEPAQALTIRSTVSCRNTGS